MIRIFPRFAFIAITSLILLGCAVGPDYKRPFFKIPEAFRGAHETPSSPVSIADLPWWEIFEDEDLQRLIRDALVNNQDLRIAVTRVEQARQIAAQARAQFFPFVNYDGNVAIGRNAILGSVSPGSGATTDSALLDFSVFWEVDFWGRIRRLNEAARADYLASDEGRRGVMISLVGDVATAYFELLELDASLEIARKTTESFGETLKIFSMRLEEGTASRLETATAQAYLGSVAANVPELERQIMLKENQINVLTGRNPGPIERSSTLLRQTMRPDIPAGLPSALLERRPDIRQAEQNLRAANARIGVAAANFFPRIGLTSLFGRVSPELSAFTSGTASLWSVGGTMTGPVFQGGALVAQYRQAKAEWEEKRLAYEQAVLNSLQEVSNALISRQKLQEVRERQTETVQSYEEAVQVSLKRYTAGKASYYEVLQNQQQLFPAELTLSRTQLNQLLVIVQLYRAIGGGWERMEPVEGARSQAGPGPGTTESAVAKPTVE